jgi:hypothetical protein
MSHNVTEDEAIHPDRVAEVSRGQSRSCRRRRYGGTRNSTISRPRKMLVAWSVASPLQRACTRLQRNEPPFHSFLRIFRSGRSRDQAMQNIKFLVKVNRGARAPQYVQRVDPTPIHMTSNRKLALVMGKFTTEDAIKSLQNPELESVQVSADSSR